MYHIFVRLYDNVTLTTVVNYSPRSPGLRHASKVQQRCSKKVCSPKSLVHTYSSNGGRNSQGVITMRSRGGRVKAKFRAINSVRKILTKSPVKFTYETVACGLYQVRDVFAEHPKYFILIESSAKVKNIEYASCCTIKLALLSYKNGRREYILVPRTLKIDLFMYVGSGTTRDIGTTRALGLLPSGCISYNVELKPGVGGKIARSAGTFTQLLAKTFRFVTLKLPSKEIRLVFKNCKTTIGQVYNFMVQNLIMGKAGKKRWLGRRAKVRGVAMNPNDHPHGGGEGRSPIGRKSPVTPWGKIALGPKTRDPRKKSNTCILRFRHVKTQ